MFIKAISGTHHMEWWVGEEGNDIDRYSIHRRWCGWYDEIGRIYEMRIIKWCI